MRLNKIGRQTYRIFKIKFMKFKLKHHQKNISHLKFTQLKSMVAHSLRLWANRNSLKLMGIQIGKRVLEGKLAIILPMNLPSDPAIALLKFYVEYKPAILRKYIMARIYRTAIFV